jgi:mercuric ion transport protein
MNNEKSNRSGLIATGGTLTGMFAVIGASCCILPIILVNLGVSSALVSHLGFFARYRPWFMALTICLVIGGFIYAYRGGRKPSRKVLVFLILAGILAVGSTILPYYEGDIQRWLNL